MPVLMLGGARDEVVPRSQMQELWAIIRNRGSDAAASGKTRRKVAAATGGAPVVSGEDGRRALATAIQITEQVGASLKSTAR